MGGGVKWVGGGVKWVGGDGWVHCDVGVVLDMGGVV